MGGGAGELYLDMKTSHLSGEHKHWNIFLNNNRTANDFFFTEKKRFLYCYLTSRIYIERSTKHYKWSLSVVNYKVCCTNEEINSPAKIPLRKRY